MSWITDLQSIKLAVSVQEESESAIWLITCNICMYSAADGAHTVYRLRILGLIALPCWLNSFVLPWLQKLRLTALQGSVMR